MVTNQLYTVKYKRRLLGKTDYRKRLKILVAHKPRLVVRKSLNHMLAQVVEYKEGGDRILATAHTRELERLGWKLPKGNVPSAYLTGLILGKKIRHKGITGLILDMGIHKSISGCRVYALVKGVLDAGIMVNHGKEILPSQERLEGRHIEEYAVKIKKEGKLDKYFGQYLKRGVDPTQIHMHVQQIKNTIIGGS